MTRSEEFAGGNAQAREPQFQSVQQQANRNFRAISTLDNVMPNQNGIGQADLQRKIVGSQGSAVGRSTSTFDRQLWLHHRDEPTPVRQIPKDN